MDLLDHILEVLLVLGPPEVWAQAHKVWLVCELLQVQVWVQVVLPQQESQGQVDLLVWVSMAPKVVVESNPH
jgi:hypothetical protein